MMRLAPMKAIQQIQLEVLTNFGTSPLQPSDCKDLSLSIGERTGKVVSETTIKRFFGFAAQTFNFSVYTLNALAEYAGYPNWESFLEHFRVQQSPPPEEAHPKWQEIKTVTGKITFYTTESIKNNTGIDFNATAPRQEILKVQQFLESDYSIAAVIAPARYGKSTFLAQAVEQLWLRDSCSYPNDACLFIQIHQIQNLINKGFSLEEWLDNQLGIGSGEGVVSYFEQHAQETRGRLVLVVDGFDEKILAHDKLKVLYAKLMNFVMSRMTAVPWLKLIVAARPDAWSALFPIPLLTPLPYACALPMSGKEPGSGQKITLPPLAETDVRSVLQHHGMQEDLLNIYSESFVRMLGFPPYLETFCSMARAREPFLFQEAYVRLLIQGEHLRSRVAEGPESPVKMSILRKVSDYYQIRPDGPGPEPSALIGTDTRLQEAYRKLIRDGILHEDSQPGPRSFPQKAVRFASEDIGNYFAVTFFVMQEAGQVRMEAVRDFLGKNGNNHRRRELTRCLLLFLLDEKRYDLLSPLIRTAEDPAEKAVLLQFLLVQPPEPAITGITRDELRDDSLRHYFLRALIMYDVQGVRGARIRELLKGVLETEEDQVCLACMHFFDGLFRLNGLALPAERPFFQQILPKTNRAGSTLHPAELCLYIDQHLNGQTPDPVTEEKILQFEDFLLLSNHAALSVRDELIVYLLITSLLLMKEYGCLHRITDFIFTEIPSLKMRSHDPFRLITLLIKCRYHLYENEPELCGKYMAHVEKVMESPAGVIGGPLVRCLLQQVIAVRHYTQGEYDKVLELAARFEVTSRGMRHPLFEHWCYRLQAATYRCLGKLKLALLAEQEALRIRERNPFVQLPPFDLDEFTVVQSGKKAMND